MLAFINHRRRDEFLTVEIASINCLFIPLKARFLLSRGVILEGGYVAPKVLVTILALIAVIVVAVVKRH